jgi:short-subunit dehydrogenase
MANQAKPLNEQVIVITGASSGIGLATALAAAEEGASVVLAARSEDTLEEIASAISTAGGEATAIPTDVTMRSDLESLASQALATYGRIDTWVNDAGVGMYGRLDEVSEEDSRQLFDINFWGIANGSLAALPYLRQSGGTLINLGSEASEAAIPLQGMYTASKHAIKGFTDVLRLELEADGNPVRVTLIQPTAVNTPYPEHAANYMDQEPKLPTPMIQPEQVAQAILEAATDPKDAIKVGTMAKVNTLMSKLMPSIGDEFAKLQIGRQQRDEPARDDRSGTLYRPGESGEVTGRGNENPANRKEAQQANTRG